MNDNFGSQLQNGKIGKIGQIWIGKTSPIAGKTVAVEVEVFIQALSSLLPRQRTLLPVQSIYWGGAGGDTGVDDAGSVDVKMGIFECES